MHMSTMSFLFTSLLRLSVMKWQLSESKYVSCYNQHVYFHEMCADYEISVTLHLNQFQSFDNVLQNIDRATGMIPLGGRLWLVSGHCLHVDGRWETFMFDDRLWKIYKQSVHPYLKSFLYYEKYGSVIHRELD